MSDYIKDKITFKEFIFSAIGWTTFILTNSILLILSPFFILFFLIFDINKVGFSYLIKFFYKFFYFLNFVQKTDIDYNNLKSPKKHERRIYAANHSSMFDVIIMCLLPGPIKSIMKESYTKMPVIGWIATLAGNIVLKDDPQEGEQMDLYYNIIEKLEKGIPIVIYPEGTKSKNSKLGKFYSGTFKIALDTKSDIVPVVFDTWNVIRPGGMWIRDVKPTIRILDTIKYEDIQNLTYKEITKIVRLKILKALLEVRDKRRSIDKNYYRHHKKYIKIDDEMKEELKILLENNSK